MCTKAREGMEEKRLYCAARRALVVFQQGHDALVDPVGLADVDAGRGVAALEVEAASAVEEPEEEAGRVGGACRGVDGEVVVGDAGVRPVDHLLRAGVAGPAVLAGQDGVAGEVVLAVVVAVGRGPGQAAGEEWGDDLVDFHGGVFQVGVLACDEVAFKDYELLGLGVEDLVHYFDGVDVLLRAPGVPGVLAKVEILEDGDLERAIAGESQWWWEIAVARGSPQW